jgi:hypothetical protein
VKFGPRTYVAVPFVSLFTAGTMDTMAIVAGAVIVAIALIAWVLIKGYGVAPRLKLGPFTLDFRPLQPPVSPPPRREDPSRKPLIPGAVDKRRTRARRSCRLLRRAPSSR